MSGIIMDEQSKIDCMNKATAFEKWLKWLDDTREERTKLFRDALARGKVIYVGKNHHIPIRSFRRSDT